MSVNDRFDILDRLAGVFTELAPELAPPLEQLALREAPMTETLEILTRIERTPGLRADLHGLVAQAKQVLTGKRDRADFLQRCYQLQGVM